MKKSLFNIAMALCIGLFAACSQEDILSPSNGGEETVSVSAQLPGNIVNTRALPGAEANHQLRCILEVWDTAEGTTTPITRIEKLASDASDGKLTFVFSVDAKVNYQCLLWADFIASEVTPVTTEDGNTTYADKYYNTTNLKAIDFKATDNTLFNNLANDAFCGAISKNGTTSTLSVTLQRPFTKVTLKDNSDYIDGCSGLSKVEYTAPSGYNIATGATTATKTISAENIQIDAANDTWFSTFIFASTTQSKLESDIIMTTTKTEGGTEEITVKGNQINLDANKENNASANFSKKDDITIDVDINGEYPDPNAPKVGYFVNKDGSCSEAYDANTAIGILFAIGAKGTDTGSKYGAGFADKKIYGYAMALTSVSEMREYLGANGTDETALPEIAKTGDDPWNVNDYNGYQYTQILTTAYADFDSKVFDCYNTWLTANSIPVATTNLSSWYIPSARQILDITGLTIGFPGDIVETDVPAITQNETIAAAFNSGNVSVFTKKDPTNIMSSYIVKANSMAAIQVGYNKNVNANLNYWPTEVNGDAKTILQKPTAAAKAFYNIRPVLTVFKP